jgi:hypothetical protein
MKEISTIVTGRDRVKVKGDDLKLYEQGEIAWWEVHSDAEQVLEKSELCSYWADQAASPLGKLGCVVQSKKLLLKYYLMLVTKELLYLSKSGVSTVADSSFLMTVIECLAGTGVLIYGVQLLPRGRHAWIDSLQDTIEQVVVYFHIDRLTTMIDSMMNPSEPHKTDLFAEDEEVVEAKLTEEISNTMNSGNLMNANQPFGVISFPGASHGEGRSTAPPPPHYEHDVTKSPSGNLGSSSSDEHMGGKAKKRVGFHEDIGLLYNPEKDDVMGSMAVGRNVPEQNLMSRRARTCALGVPTPPSKTGLKGPVRISSLSKINRQ